MAVVLGVAEAVGLSTDWVGCGAETVALAVVGAGFEVVVGALGDVVVALGAVVVGTDFSVTTAAEVAGALLVAWTVTREACVVADAVAAGISTTGL